MITITLKGKAYITGLNKIQKQAVKNLFSISNPLFNRKMEMGLSLWGVESSLKYFTVDPADGDVLITPIGGMGSLLNYLFSTGLTNKDITLVDLRVSKTDKDYFKKFTFTGALRNYQEVMIEKMEDATVGVIEAMTGSGKTVTFVKKIFDLKQNTLIVVNTLELANQARDALIEFSNLTKDDIGLVGSGKYKIKPITVSLHQTLMHLKEDKIAELNENFGMIIADEVHICAADQFYRNLTSLHMKYKFGFSATPKDRADGLSKVIFWASGPLLHVVPKTALVGSLIMPKLLVEKTSYYFPLFDTADYTYMMSDMAVDEDRNKQISNHILKNYSKDTDYVCVLCNQVSQVEELTRLLGDKAQFLTSGTRKKLRLSIMKDLIDKKIKYIVSTYALFSTGINVKHLNVLVLAAPRKSTIALKQSAGRIMRTDKGKTSATIIDFVDDKIELLRYQAKVRHKILKNLGK